MWSRCSCTKIAASVSSPSCTPTRRYRPDTGSFEALFELDVGAKLQREAAALVDIRSRSQTGVYKVRVALRASAVAAKHTGGFLPSLRPR